LNTYETGTKCSILFGRNVSNVNATAVTGCWVTHARSFEEKYIGLHVPEGRMVNGKFKSLKERFSKRVNDWSEKYLSSGGKEVLMKSVLQGLPTYAMNVFKFSPML
jgi:hypothetical protein